MKQIAQTLEITKEEAQSQFDYILCKECKGKIGLDKEYMGVVTCPYCGEYVEG